MKLPRLHEKLLLPKLRRPLRERLSSDAAKRMNADARRTPRLCAVLVEAPARLTVDRCADASAAGRATP